MQKLTDWYPPDTKPVRIGWYESKPIGLTPVIRFWDGATWCYQEQPNITLPPTLVACRMQNRQWRGLAEEPKQ